MSFRSLLLFFGLIVIVVLSFSIYAARHYPLLNSDDALNILMTYYYELPNDFYCWGQDRGGTLIPLIGQVPHKFFGLSAVNSVSVSNYFILLLGFLGFSSLFKKNTTKILFAILWFFPAIRFIDLMRFPIGVQYSLIGFSIFFINRIDFLNKKTFLNHLYFLLIILLLTLAIWVSDLAIVSVILLVSVLAFHHFIIKNNWKVRPVGIAYILIGIVGIYSFIRYAKSFATVVTQSYTKFNNWESIGTALEILKNELLNVLFFLNGDWLYTIFAWLTILFLASLIISYFNERIITLIKTNRWVLFFALDFIVIFGVLLVSKWVFLNGMGRWYFVTSYISFSMLILLLFDNLQLSGRKRAVLSSLFFAIVIIGSLSTVYHLKFIRPKSFQSQIDRKSELLTLGEIGIIGEFWNSYICACPDPAKIKATAHDKSNVRNLKLVDEVFAQPKLYLVRDMWMKEFPDTIEQFGFLLTKKGEEFRLADCVLCEYDKIKREKD